MLNAVFGIWQHHAAAETAKMKHSGGRPWKACEGRGRINSESYSVRKVAAADKRTVTCQKISFPAIRFRNCSIKQQRMEGSYSGQMCKADTDTQSQGCFAVRAASTKYWPEGW